MKQLLLRGEGRIFLREIDFGWMQRKDYAGRSQKKIILIPWIGTLRG
jgi:hypothetical protein